MLRNFTPAVLIGILLLSCHKHSGKPAFFTVKGQVVDTVTHRILSNVKVYLLGGSDYMGNLTYYSPALDSVATDAHGNFVLPHSSETFDNVYALTVEVPTAFNGYQFQPNCYLDSNSLFIPIQPGSGVPVKIYARAVGLTRLNLKVDSNPYDTLVISTMAEGAPGANWSDTITGAQVDVSVLIPTLPLSANTIEIGIFTAFLRDSINAPFYKRRRLDDYPVTPGALDTPVLDVHYASAYDIKL